MKIDFKCENNITVVINKQFLKNVDFNDKKSLEEYFKKLFCFLQNKEDVKLNGYYNIDMYIDEFYGIVINIEKDDIEYYDYFTNQVDMRIATHKNISFLYKINDYLSFDNNIVIKGEILKYDNNYYFKLNSEIDNIAFGNLLENTELVYEKNVCKKIIRCNTKI